MKFANTTKTIVTVSCFSDEKKSVVICFWHALIVRKAPGDSLPQACVNENSFSVQNVYGPTVH